MSNEKIICNSCKKEVEKQTGCMPTWFGRYKNEKCISVICKDCLVDNREKWRKGEI